NGDNWDPDPGWYRTWLGRLVPLASPNQHYSDLKLTPWLMLALGSDFFNFYLTLFIFSLVRPLAKAIENISCAIYRFPFISLAFFGVGNFTTGWKVDGTATIM
ncbi:hypothetical protein HAX54_018138, partial [Datura stramonium]|nr:hypothetical protein [Datura stramonium]